MHGGPFLGIRSPIGPQLFNLGIGGRWHASVVKRLDAIVPSSSSLRGIGGAVRWAGAGGTLRGLALVDLPFQADAWACYAVNRIDKKNPKSPQAPSLTPPACANV